MQENWFPIMRDDGKNRYAFMVNVGYRDAGAAPDPQRPVFTVIRVKLERAGEEGLGESDEVAGMDEKFDAASVELASSGAVFVARGRMMGRMEFLLYSGSEARLGIERAAKGAFGDKVLAIDQRDDAAWAIYMDLLPTPLEERVVLDALVVQQLAAAGDPLTPKRDVVHFAYFPDEASANEFAKEVTRRGFKVEVAPSAEPKAGAMIGVQASRDDSVQMPGISEITGELAELAVAKGGTYDGWEAAVVQKKRGMLSRFFKN